MESSCTAVGDGGDVKVVYEQSIFIDLKLQQMSWNELNKAQMWGEWRAGGIYRCWKKNPYCHGDGAVAEQEREAASDRQTRWIHRGQTQEEEEEEEGRPGSQSAEAKDGA